MSQPVTTQPVSQSSQMANDSDKVNLMGQQPGLTQNTADLTKQNEIAQQSQLPQQATPTSVAANENLSASQNTSTII